MYVLPVRLPFCIFPGFQNTDFRLLELLPDLNLVGRRTIPLGLYGL